VNNESNALVVPPGMARFFKKAPLLITESRQEYDALFNCVAQTIAPTNILEWISTRNYIDTEWEIRRKRNAKSAIINMTRKEALRMILESILPEAHDRIELAACMADRWSNPDERPDILQLLEMHDLDDDAISAQAMALRVPEIEKIDEMIQQLEISSMARLREIEFHRRASSWRAPKELQQVVDVVAEPIQLPPPGDDTSAEPHAGGLQ
jgi:hypothetical protein